MSKAEKLMRYYGCKARREQEGCKTAQMYQVSEDKMPTRIFIISDMEFNRCGRNTNLQGIKQQYEKAGYKLPQLVFWNVNAKTTHFPATLEDENTILVSGASPSVFKLAMSNKSATDVLLDTLNSPRYEQIC